MKTFILPNPGDRISFCGDHMTAVCIKNQKGNGFDLVARMDNGIEVVLWWRDDESCKII